MFVATNAFRINPFIKTFSSRRFVTLPLIDGLCRYRQRPVYQTSLVRCASTSSQSDDANRRKFKTVLIGGAIFGAMLIANDYKEKYVADHERALQEGNFKILSPILVEKPPDHSLARSISNPNDKSGIKLTLYQFQTCPFCCKVRAYLDYFGFSYDVVEVNSVTRKQVKWTDYKKVPMLLVEQENGGEDNLIFNLKDSTVIMSSLSSVLRNPKKDFMSIIDSYPAKYKDDKIEFSNKYFIMGEDTKDSSAANKLKHERKWRQWVDDKFVHMLSPNVYRTPSESLQAFHWFSEIGDWERLFPTWERLLVVYLGAAVMWVIGKRLKSRHNLKDDVRESLFDHAKQWTKALKATGGPFMGGKTPNLADVAMYGVMTAIEGCDAFGELLEATNIDVWFSQMKDSVRKREGQVELIRRGPIPIR